MKIFALLTLLIFPQALLAELQQIHVEAKLTADKEVQIILHPPSHWIDSQSKILTVDEAVIYFDRMMLMDDGATIMFVSNNIQINKFIPVLRMIRKNTFLRSLHIDGKLITPEEFEKIEEELEITKTLLA